ncbi:L-2-hydroxyglutarate oxidase [Corynebacterium riegelii]|uniref:L-2-hydroxyglutarate oxidase n=1 Tax=Corynebacterium riegelii TaxID=156976 RepID=UPI00288B20F9|nr:L-2-hydroxyglutarate oxidase [Corynebacterium riegelii]
MNEPIKFAVIGAGINGAAVARELSNRYPESSVTVFEKSSDPGAHQTGHNSGVVHAGLYYEPGSLKARLCRRGVELLKAYATEKKLPYEECGKLVVALNDQDEERLKDIYARSVANKVPGVALLGEDEIREIEPNAHGTLALHSPETAITDYAAIARSFIEDVRQQGGIVRLSTEVLDIESTESSVIVTSTHGSEEFDYLVTCAGLQSDRLARMAGGAEYPVIVPFFGQYLQLPTEYEKVTNGLIYPVPDPKYPFLGVHLTKRVDGAMLVGPNAFLSFGRETYSGLGFNLRDSIDIARELGFWRFALQNAPAATRELRGVLSRRQFIDSAAVYVPIVEGAKGTPLTRGIRAQAMAEDGSLIDDFVIEHVGRSTLIRNAPSPGATSSLAIAEYIVDELERAHGLQSSNS